MRQKRDDARAATPAPPKQNESPITIADSALLDKCYEPALWATAVLCAELVVAGVAEDSDTLLMADCVLGLRDELLREMS